MISPHFLALYIYSYSLSHLSIIINIFLSVFFYFLFCLVPGQVSLRASSSNISSWFPVIPFHTFSTTLSHLVPGHLFPVTFSSILTSLSTINNSRMLTTSSLTHVPYSIWPFQLEFLTPLVVLGGHTATFIPS